MSLSFCLFSERRKYENIEIDTRNKVDLIGNTYHLKGKVFLHKKLTK